MVRCAFVLRTIKAAKIFGLEVHVIPQNFAPSKNFPKLTIGNSLIIDNIPSWFDVHVFPPIEDRKLEVNVHKITFIMWSMFICGLK